MTHLPASPHTHSSIHSSIPPPLHTSSNVITHTQQSTHLSTFLPFHSCKVALVSKRTLQWKADSAVGKGRAWQGQGRRGPWSRQD